MSHLLGAVMIIGGSLGIGLRYIEAKRKEIDHAEIWKHIMQMYISEITYKKQPLSIAANVIGEKIGGPEGDLLKKIRERMQERKQEGFFQIWKQECLAYCDKENIKKEERELLLEFGILTGFEDEVIQRKMIEEQMKKWDSRYWQKQKEHRERKRLILILSSCMGIMAVLILW